MSVRADGDIVRLEGDCRVEDAETLVALLQARTSVTVDLSQCRVLHSAVVQALLVLRPPMRGEVDDVFLRTWVLPPTAGSAGDA